MSESGFALGMALQRVHAGLSLKLDDELGVRHGIDFTDFVLLDLLANANAGRATIAECVHPSGLQRSAVLKRLLALEKIGLVERVGLNDGRQVGLRPAGRSLAQLARETVSVVCDDLVTSRSGLPMLELKQSLIE